MKTEGGQPSREILLVNFEPAVLRIIKPTVERVGFICLEIDSSQDANFRFSETFDIALIDFDTTDRLLIYKITQHLIDPVLLVSTTASERLGPLSVELGAVDFIISPFLPEELIARIEGAIRRKEGRATSADELTPNESRNSNGSKPITVAFGSLERRLLNLLRVYEGEPVPSERIIGYVWRDGEARQDRNVRVLISLLRRKIEAQKLPLTIVNEHGRGYRLHRKARRELLPQDS